MKKIKNIKISVESHELLKKYCEKKGLKIYKFLENLIKKNCMDLLYINQKLDLESLSFVAGHLILRCLIILLILNQQII